jgi:hypothetical protein
MGKDSVHGFQDSKDEGLCSLVDQRTKGLVGIIKERDAGWVPRFFKKLKTAESDVNVLEVSDRVCDIL